MAIGYFTHFCAFLRLSFNKAIIFCLYRSLPSRFNQALAIGLCGRSVFVSAFPTLVPGFSPLPSGWYFVVSVAIDHLGFFEVGLTDNLDSEQIDYYYFSDLRVDNIK